MQQISGNGTHGKSAGSQDYSDLLPVKLQKADSICM